MSHKNRPRRRQDVFAMNATGRRRQRGVVVFDIAPAKNAVPFSADVTTPGRCPVRTVQQKADIRCAAAALPPSAPGTIQVTTRHMPLRVRVAFRKINACAHGGMQHAIRCAPAGFSCCRWSSFSRACNDTMSMHSSAPSAQQTRFASKDNATTPPMQPCLSHNAAAVADARLPSSAVAGTRTPLFARRYAPSTDALLCRVAGPIRLSRHHAAVC